MLGQRGSVPDFEPGVLTDEDHLLLLLRLLFLWTSGRAEDGAEEVVVVLHAQVLDHQLARGEGVQTQRALESGLDVLWVDEHVLTRGKRVKIALDEIQIDLSLPYLSMDLLRVFGQSFRAFEAVGDEERIADVTADQPAK